MTSWREWAWNELDVVREAGRWRSPVTVDARGPEGTLVDGTKVVSFASNDYLGLSAHPALARAAHEAIDWWGTSSTAARLIVGSRPVHDELEAALWVTKADIADFPNRGMTMPRLDSIARRLIEDWLVGV